MFRRTFLAVIAGAALLSACDKNKEDEIIPVSFSSFGFYTENNAGVLKSDYVSEEITSESLSFTLPYGTDPDAVKSLVPSFTATEGASVNLADASGAPDGTEIISGVTPVDFSSSVQFVIFLKNNYKVYTVSVAIAEPARWVKVAESSESMSSDPVMAISPKDGVPYLAGSVTNADKVAEPHLLKLEGSELKDVAGAMANVSSKYFAIAIDRDGTPFVSFYDGSLAKQSLMKVSGTSASYVGEAGSMYKTGGTSNSSVAVFPVADNDVWCAQYNDDRSGVDVSRRALNLAHYDGSAWSNANAISGRSATDFAYNVSGRTVSGIPYLFVYNQNTQSISVYKYKNKAWNTMFESLKIKQADGTTDATLNLRAMDFDIASDGSIYVMAGADYSTAKVYNIGVVKISADGSSQQLVGGEMTNVNIDTYRNASMSLDSNDVPYVTYTKTGEGSTKYLCITHIDSKTKTWADGESLSSESCDFAVIRFSESGTGYVAAKVKRDSEYKYILFSSAE